MGKRPAIRPIGEGTAKVICAASVPQVSGLKPSCRPPRFLTVLSVASHGDAEVPPWDGGSSGVRRQIAAADHRDPGRAVPARAERLRPWLRHVLVRRRTCRRDVDADEYAFPVRWAPHRRLPSRPPCDDPGPRCRGTGSARRAGSRGRMGVGGSFGPAAPRGRAQPPGRHHGHDHVQHDVDGRPVPAARRRRRLRAAVVCRTGVGPGAPTDFCHRRRTFRGRPPGDTGGALRGAIRGSSQSRV